MRTNELSIRIPDIVGRDTELKRLKDLLHRRGERHFLYYYADGGLGKTRLLEALNKLVDEANQKESGYASTGIIDLYHTDTHSTSDVERAIIDGLDPSQNYFPLYRSERKKFEEWRERGIEPDILERHRQGLSKLFVDEWGKMALDARKLVLCFDTVELLQYESSIVEEKAGLDTTDTRLKPWLLDKLSQLKNVLVVFAGRPKFAAPQEDFDPQKRLLGDFQKAFGNDFIPIELEALSLKETEAFLKSISGNNEVIPAKYLPIIHRLTSGRPIFIHLIVDYLSILVPGTRDYFEFLDGYLDLVNASNDDPRLQQARERTEIAILDSVFNHGDELGEYLGHIALVPKGVDAEILHATLGMTLADADALIEQLSGLSFIKHYIPPRGAERLHGERIFLHDELYKLLSKYPVIRSRSMNEIRTAYGLVENYYNPLVQELDKEIIDLKPIERISVRERLQKLQVERLYYLLANDPCAGYEEYKRLTAEANLSRSVGFSMRLLDEFLRFYNDEQRRKRFKRACITYEQVIRESANLWVERFHWWGQSERARNLARSILDNPESFYIRPQEDRALLTNICARWLLNSSMLDGYSKDFVDEVLVLLDSLPPLNECDSTLTMAKARLESAVGYQYRLGGLIVQATHHYLMAKAAYEHLEAFGGNYPDEHSMLLNNLSYAYARQGRMSLAGPLAYEAMAISGKSDYSQGLNLSTLATIARMRGDYAQAKKYAEKAFQLFFEMNDPHGMALARLSIAFADRRLAKHDNEKRWEIETAFENLTAALAGLEQALQDAEEAKLESDVRTLQAEKGRIYRELGKVANAKGELEQSRDCYGQGRKILEQVLESVKLAPIDRADILQDLAEISFLSGDRITTQEHLNKLDVLITNALGVTPEKSMPSEIHNEIYAPLAKSEVFKGQMAFAEKKPFDGLQHYVWASVYFSMFSPEAVETDTMLDVVYNNLRPLPLPEKQNLMKTLRQWIEQEKLMDKSEEFIGNLSDLLGV